MDPGAEPGVGRPEQGGVQRRRIAEEIRLGPGGDRQPGAPQQGLDVDPDQRRRQETDRGKDAEPSAHIGWHLERRNAFPPGQFAERSLDGVGGEGDVTRGGIRAKGLIEPAANHQILSQGFRGAARLADDIHEHPSRIDPPERRGNRGRIDVLEDGEFWEVVPLLVGEFIPGRWFQRREQGLGAEGRAPDPEDEDVVVGLADAFGEPGDTADHLGLVAEPVEAVFPLAPPRAHLRKNGGEPAGQFGQPASAKPVLAVEFVADDSAVMELHVGISKVMPS